jgi:hypothetical protein
MPKAWPGPVGTHICALAFGAAAEPAAGAFRFTTCFFFPFFLRPRLGTSASEGAVATGFASAGLSSPSAAAAVTAAAAFAAAFACAAAIALACSPCFLSHSRPGKLTAPMPAPPAAASSSVSTFVSLLLAREPAAAASAEAAGGNEASGSAEVGFGKNETRFCCCSPASRCSSREFR